MIFASHVRRMDEGWRGDAHLYRLSQLVEYNDVDGNKHYTSHVVISAKEVLGTPETMIFPTDEDGNAIEFLELPGSFKGDLNHSNAIQLAGWHETRLPTTWIV